MTIAEVWKIIFPYIRNKYLLTIVIFVLWMLLFDSSSWVDVIRQIRQIRKLEQDREYYIEKIQEDRNRLKELRTNNENLEKFAREQYLMKKPDEDIFVIEEDWSWSRLKLTRIKACPELAEGIKDKVKIQTISLA